MPVPSSFADLDPVAANNSPPGTESAKGNVDNYFRAHAAFLKQLHSAVAAPAQASVASAATVDLGAQASPSVIITGTTTITSFGTVAEGITRQVVFSGALTLTHNSTSLILPGGQNITTAAGDCATFLSLGSGNWRCTKYQSGSALARFSKGANIASAATLNLSTATGNLVHITGTTSITALTMYAGQQIEVIFDGALTLTHHTTSLNLPSGQNITTTAGSRATFAYDGTTVYCTNYVDSSTSPVGLVQGTSQATTSGTSKDYTSIPSWVKRITISFSGTSTNGTSIPMVQIGDSGGIENTGYLGSASNTSATPSAASMSSGFIIAASWTAASVWGGQMVLTLTDSATNTWACTCSGGFSSTAATTAAAGSKSLSATLDRIRFTMANGTDAFDAGIWNIMYE